MPLYRSKDKHLEDTLRERNPIWDTLTELFGAPTPSQQRLYGKVTKELRDMNATPESIIDAAMAIASEWGKKAVTPTSLAKWYTRHQSLIATLPDDPADVRMAIKFRDMERRYEQEALE